MQHITNVTYLHYPRLFSIQEIFEAIPKLKDNPLVQRVVEVFDEDQSGGVDFKEFVLGNVSKLCKEFCKNFVNIIILFLKKTFIKFHLILNF